MRLQLEKEFEKAKKDAGPTFDPEKVKNASKLRDSVYRDILRAPITPSAYANELYQIAKDKNKVDQLNEEVLKLLAVLGDKEDSLNYRLMGFGNMTDLNKTFLSEMNSAFKLSPELHEFLGSLITRFQFPNTIDILKGFVKKVSLSRKEVYGALTTAAPLTPEQLKAVQKQFQLFINKDEKLFLETNVDPSIGGGYFLELPTGILDATDKKQWTSFVGDYVEQLQKSFQSITVQETPQQKAINQELKEVFGADKVPTFLRNL